jgi:hypothetical protein
VPDAAQAPGSIPRTVDHRSCRPMTVCPFPKSEQSDPKSLTA